MKKTTKRKATIKTSIDEFKNVSNKIKCAAEKAMRRHVKSRKEVNFKLAIIKNNGFIKTAGITQEQITQNKKEIKDVLEFVYPTNFNDGIKISTQFKCALCFKGPNSWNDSDELYGPVVADLVDALIPEELKLQEDISKDLSGSDTDDSYNYLEDFEPYFEFTKSKHYVVFHKQCMLHAHQLNVISPEYLIKVGDQLEEFWKKKCSICSQKGAFVLSKESSKNFHHLHCTQNNK